MHIEQLFQILILSSDFEGVCAAVIFKCEGWHFTRMWKPKTGGFDPYNQLIFATLPCQECKLSSFPLKVQSIPSHGELRVKINLIHWCTLVNINLIPWSTANEHIVIIDGPNHYTTTSPIYIYEDMFPTESMDLYRLKMIQCLKQKVPQDNKLQLKVSSEMAYQCQTCMGSSVIVITHNLSLVDRLID